MKYKDLEKFPISEETKLEVNPFQDEESKEENLQETEQTYIIAVEEEESKGEPKFFLAHVVKARGHGTLLDKLEKNKLNINTTIILPVDSSQIDPLNPSVKINTYANSDWKHHAGVLFDDTALFLGFFASDIGSGEFSGFNYDGSITSEVMQNIANWVKRSDLGDYRRGRMQRTPEAAVDKLKEISLRRVNQEIDHASTVYFNVNGEQTVYTGMHDKFSNKDSNLDGRSRTLMPQDRLRHNETHIRTSLLGIDSVFVVQEDFDQNNYVALTSLLNLHKELNQAKSKVGEGEIAVIKSRMTQYIKYYGDAIELLDKKVEQYTLSLQALERGEKFTNEDLEKAFERKKNKNKDFDRKSLENKKIWLSKHIKIMRQDQRCLGSLIEYSKENSQDEAIQASRGKEIKICIYDAEKAQITQISQEELQTKIDQIPLHLRFIQTIADNTLAQNMVNNKIASVVGTASLGTSFYYLLPFFDQANVTNVLSYTWMLPYVTAPAVAITTFTTTAGAVNILKDTKKTPLLTLGLVGAAVPYSLYLYPYLTDVMTNSALSSVELANIVAVSSVSVAAVSITQETKRTIDAVRNNPISGSLVLAGTIAVSSAFIYPLVVEGVASLVPGAVEAANLLAVSSVLFLSSHTTKGAAIVSNIANRTANYVRNCCFHVKERFSSKENVQELIQMEQIESKSANQNDLAVEIHLSNLETKNPAYDAVVVELQQKLSKQKENESIPVSLSSSSLQPNPDQPANSVKSASSSTIQLPVSQKR